MRIWKELFSTISNKQLLTEILWYMHVTQIKPTNSLFTKPLLRYWLKRYVINRHVPCLSYSSLKHIWFSLTTYVVHWLSKYYHDITYAKYMISINLLLSVLFIGKKEHFIQFTSTAVFCRVSVPNGTNTLMTRVNILMHAFMMHSSISHLYHTWTACLPSVKISGLF
jgi:hypothetical protein